MTAFLSSILGYTSVAALLACSQATSPPPGGAATQSIGRSDRLSGAEWTAYVANAQYVRSLAPPGVPIRLNFADPRQHAFALSRLQLAGKTPENSPYLFERIAERRLEQIARGTKLGAAAQILDAPANGRIEMHYIESARFGVAAGAAAANAAAPTQLSGTASSTVPGGSVYTYLDMQIFAASSVPLGDLQIKEEFEGGGQNLTVTASGDPALSSLTRYAYESQKFEDLPDGKFNDSFTHVEVGSELAQVAATMPQLSLPHIDAPVDLVGLNGGRPDGLISLCMDRAWTNDCDYILDTGTDTAHRIWAPLSGFITVTTPHVIDRRKYEALKATLAGGLKDPNEGLLKLVLTNVGGGCDVDANNALNAGMSGFWSNTKLSDDNKTLFWDLTGEKAARFDEGCTQIQNRAKLTLRVPLPVVAVGGTAQFTTSFTISNDPETLRADKTLLPITLTNSCLAEGTEIQVGDDRFAAIETLHIGQVVFNPFAGGSHASTIKDTAKGTEAAPMVRIRDAAGHTLLMTEMHPIATADRGMVQARALRTGDVVMTRQGPSKLIEVSREPYAGKVYNLKIGSDAEQASLGPDQTVVYANGFLVGDGQIQSKYEELAQRRAPATVEQVSERWRRDYLHARSSR